MQGRKKVQRLEGTQGKLSEGKESQEGNPGEESELVSLEELGNAYAKALETQDPRPSSLDFSGNIAVRGETDGVPVTLASIIEALLFVGAREDDSLSFEDLCRILKEFQAEEIRKAIDDLGKDLVSQSSSVRVVGDDQGYRLELVPELEESIEQIKWGPAREAVLSQVAIDCLSLIAYQPGISKSDLDKQLGQSAGLTVSNLIKRGLVLEADGCYQTTERFLEIAGIESLEELPRAEDI